MWKKSARTILAVFVVFMMLAFAVQGFSQEEQKVTGQVTAVDAAAKMLSIDNQQYTVSDEVMTYFDVEVGDEVEVILENTDKGPVVVDYFYI